jgi:hypothetical protein
MPMVGLRGALYYIVTDSATGKGVEGYGCETWAQHRADEMNRKEKKGDECQDLTNK